MTSVAPSPQPNSTSRDPPSTSTASHQNHRSPFRIMQRQKTLIDVHSSDWLPHSSLFTNPQARGFISESGIVFKFVQRLSLDQEPLSLPDLIKASRKYRSVIHSWFIKLNEHLSNDPHGELSIEEHAELYLLTKTLHKIEIAWHLCEILFIDIRSPGAFLWQLFHWINWHFTDHVEIANEVIVADSPQMHEHYWDSIFTFVLRGEMENAVLFLELHSGAKIEPAFILISDLLRKFPILTNNQVIHEYFIRWEIWHENVLRAVNEQKIERNNKNSNNQLNLLLNLMAGEIEAFQQVTHLFKSWYEMMVSYLLFSDPCLKRSKLDSLSSTFINAYYLENQNFQKDSFDELIVSAFDYNLIDVINRSSLCFNDNWWFVTHFIDLIYNSNQFKDYQIADIGQIRDAFVTDYADSLFARPKQFWRLSIEYLVHCKDSQERILLYLENISFDNEQQLQTLLSLVRRFNFAELELSLYKIQARKWLTKAVGSQKKKLGSALFWAIRSKNKMLINFIVDQYLRHYLRTAAEEVLKTEKISSTGELLDMDMVMNIGNALVLSDRLIFLCKYHEFRCLRNSSQFSQAAKILVDMLASNAIPEFFIFQVILDCLPLLELRESQAVIGSEQTCKILASLEHVLERLKNEPEECSLFWLENNSKATSESDQDMNKIKEYQRNIMKKCEKTLRLAISRNLANNFIIPNAENTSFSAQASC